MQVSNYNKKIRLLFKKKQKNLLAPCKIRLTYIIAPIIAGITHRPYSSLLLDGIVHSE